MPILDHQKMLFSLKDKLAGKSFILASSSPRRREILEKLGLKFRVLTPSVEENLKLSDFASVGELVEALAKLKADNTLTLITQGTNCDCLISADTVIYFEGRIIGKPSDQLEATMTLRSLSGKAHEVYTGVCVHWMKSGRVVATDLFHSRTSVKMSTLDGDIIEAYVSTGEPMDKAGAYAIQGSGCNLVESIEGDYFTVVGLPAYELSKRILAKYREGYW